MVDLGRVLELLQADQRREACPHAGTGRGRDKLLQLNEVPAVPVVPTPNKQLRVIDVADVLERAAILEFCAGLDRVTSDRQALAEIGCGAWSDLNEGRADGDLMTEPEANWT